MKENEERGIITSALIRKINCIISRNRINFKASSIDKRGLLNSVLILEVFPGDSLRRLATRLGEEFLDAMVGPRLYNRLLSELSV